MELLIYEVELSMCLQVVIVLGLIKLVFHVARMKPRQGSWDE